MQLPTCAISYSYPWSSIIDGGTLGKIQVLADDFEKCNAESSKVAAWFFDQLCLTSCRAYLYRELPEQVPRAFLGSKGGECQVLILRRTLLPYVRSGITSTVCRTSLSSFPSDPLGPDFFVVG